MKNIHCHNCKYYLDSCMGQNEDVLEQPDCFKEYQEEHQEDYQEEYEEIFEDEIFFEEEDEWY